MPSKNIIKQYVENGYYHIYNRGVDKRTIFQTDDDYFVFMRFLKEYLLPLGHPQLDLLSDINPRRAPINCFEDIDLIAYCLMPNHFHLLVKQKTKKGLEKFMRALATNYVMYFNRKYKRIGPLFQGRYKAALIDEDSYFTYISGYIHANPVELITRDGPLQKLEDYSFSSYPMYLGERNYEWVKPDDILSIFTNDSTKMSSYKQFVEDIAFNKKSKDGELTEEEVFVEGLTLEN